MTPLFLTLTIVLAVLGLAASIRQAAGAVSAALVGLACSVSILLGFAKDPHVQQFLMPLAFIALAVVIIGLGFDVYAKWDLRRRSARTTQSQ